MILHMYIPATRVLTRGDRFTFWSSNYWYPLRVSALPQSWMLGRQPVWLGGSWSPETPVLLGHSNHGSWFLPGREGEWHNVYGVVDDISWRWLRYFHIAPFGIHLGFAWDWRYWTWLKIWVFRSPFVDWKWSEGPKTQDNSAVFCCEAAQLRCWVAWGTWKRDWNDLSAVSL